METLDRAITAGQQRNIRLVVGPAIANASRRDMDYLRARAVDEQISSTADIAVRMGAN